MRLIACHTYVVGVLIMTYSAITVFTIPHGHTCGVIGGFVGAGVPHRGESGEPLGASEGVERERLAFERASLARALV